MGRGRRDKVNLTGEQKNSCKLIICYNDGLTNFPQKIS
jgi:hypothetical protein